MNAAEPTPGGWRDPGHDPAVERRIHQLAIPVALVLALAVSRSGLRGITRVFVTMWVHELGHAVTAWLCGFGAFPGPWRTPVSEGRVVPVTLLVLGLVGYTAVRAFRGGATVTASALAALALVSLGLTLGLRPRQAQALITFGGDAGSLVLGTLMMATIYAPPGSALHRGWLRWGFLVIGALAFMDAFTEWWTAGHSPEGVVFGEIEGVGESDPTRLVMAHGWSEARLVSRYLTLGWSCLTGLAAVYLSRALRRREA